MGKPYNERRRTLNLAAHRLRAEGRTNKEIAEQIGVRIEQVPGMALAGRRIAQAETSSAPMPSANDLPVLADIWDDPANPEERRRR